jgi:hypothetical protein
LWWSVLLVAETNDLVKSYTKLQRIKLYQEHIATNIMVIEIEPLLWWQALIAYTCMSIQPPHDRTRKKRASHHSETKSEGDTI